MLVGFGLEFPRTYSKCHNTGLQQGSTGKLLDTRGKWLELRGALAAGLQGQGQENIEYRKI